MNDAERSVFAWLRFGNPGDAPCLVICNMTPVERSEYRIGLSSGGHWSEVLNSDAGAYGGGNRGNLGGKDAEHVGSHGRDWSMTVVLPPLSTLVFKLDQ